MEKNRDIKFGSFVGEKTPTKAGFLQTLKRGKWNTNEGGNICYELFQQ